MGFILFDPIRRPQKYKIRKAVEYGSSFSKVCIKQSNSFFVLKYWHLFFLFPCAGGGMVKEKNKIAYVIISISCCLTGEGWYTILNKRTES